MHVSTHHGYVLRSLSVKLQDQKRFKVGTNQPGHRGELSLLPGRMSAYQGKDRTVTGIVLLTGARSADRKSRGEHSYSLTLVRRQGSEKESQRGHEGPLVLDQHR